ncbi:hypothetical protein E4U33_005114 [Claviceps sp. LM78 group G4]|nr:hypothetical protein E4U33_005114 [Claviceps sp. LM78 group G4]
MSPSSTSSSPRSSCATQPSAASPRTPSEDEDGDLDSDLDEDINGDLDSVSGTEDELERASRRRRRRARVTEYRPRRRNHGELRRQQQPAI